MSAQVSNSLALGIWSVAVLSTYIQLLEGDSPDATQKVGMAQAIQGSCLAAAALPRKCLLYCCYMNQRSFLNTFSECT